ncbi:MAG: RNA-binding cell elongation regulator Jag/EloR [Chloroflexota bacterium]
MKSVEKRGRSVEEAVRAALDELGVEREAVDVEVLEEGSKGIFGLLAREARVLVSLKSAPADDDGETVSDRPAPRPVGEVNADIEGTAVRLIEDIARAMGIAVECQAHDNGEAIEIDVSGADVGGLIGRRGQTLDALQYLVNLAANKNAAEHRRIIVDAEGYRRRREETLRRLAVQLAERARRSGRDVVLEPMAAYERRIIHLELQDHPYVTTRSIGEEPYRKVVITTKK